MKGISQEELANLVVVCSIYISYLETGSKTPSLELLVLIANGEGIELGKAIRKTEAIYGL